MADWGDWNDDWGSDGGSQDWQSDVDQSWQQTGGGTGSGTGSGAGDNGGWSGSDGWSNDYGANRHAEPTPIHTSQPDRQNRTGVSGLNPSKDVFVGIAQNVQSMPERQRTFFSAWIDSLIYGVPFVNGKVRNVFNLQLLDVEESMSITQQRSIAVTFFGEANTGLIGRGQTLQVKGKYGADRTVYASEIVNLTNGSLISIDGGIPGGVIRVVTLVLALVIASFFFSVPIPGLGNINILPNINWEMILLYGVLIALGIWWVLNQLRHPSRTTFKVVGVIILLLLLYLVPSVGSPLLLILIMCFGMYLAAKSLFR